MTYRIESKLSGKGHTVQGSFYDAVQEAMGECWGTNNRWVVWKLPENVKVAEVSQLGIEWRLPEALV